MATVTTTHAEPSDDGEYVYFHSGSQATYRKVTKAAKGEFTSIPEIDISNIDSPSLEERKKIAKEIYDACSVSGFFYLINHGIPEEVLNQTFEIMKRFFELDHDTKMDAHVQRNPAIRGYEPPLETRNDPRTKGDFKEAFTMGDCVIEPEQDYKGRVGADPPAHITKPQNIWPKDAPFFREGLYRYYSHVFPLAMKLVRIFALAFGLEETALDSIFKFPITGMRALHYPPMPVEEDGTIGLGAHTDFSWLTMVLQDSVPALEILNKDGAWVQAPPKPNSFVCNVGQYLERQTNGKFVATVHRVRNQTGERRYSLPFFLTPDPDANMHVLESFIAPGEKAGYEPFNVGDLYIRRVLPARHKHPTSIKYKDVPESEWKYELLYG